MTTDEIIITEQTQEVKTNVTVFDELNERGHCMKPNCGTPTDQLIKRVSINGFVSLTCPKCGCIHTKNWFKYRVPDPDFIKKIVDWVV